MSSTGVWGELGLARSPRASTGSAHARHRPDASTTVVSSQAFSKMWCEEWPLCAEGRAWLVLLVHFRKLGCACRAMAFVVVLCRMIVCVRGVKASTPPNSQRGGATRTALVVTLYCKM